MQNIHSWRKEVSHVAVMHWRVLFLNYATLWAFFATISIPNLNSPLICVHLEAGTQRGKFLSVSSLG